MGYNVNKCLQGEIMGEDESRKREKLSAAQKRVLDAVKGFYILNGYPPLALLHIDDKGDNEHHKDD